MITITDINTRSENLIEIEDLKKSFHKRLSINANEGSVVIINNIPSIGNIIGPIDQLISLSINKVSRNYLNEKILSENHYVDNFILLIKKVDEYSINSANEQFIFSENGEFDYLESIRKNIFSFENFLTKFASLKVFFIYEITTNTNFKYTGKYLTINNKLNSTQIITSVVEQYLERFGNERISSTSKTNPELLYGDNNLEFCKSLLSEINKISKIGILTKNKIDRISNTTKIVEQIYENTGKRISIISGKAGTGKTLVLQRILHKSARQGNRIRYLTYNNLLVFDIKQNLRTFGFSGDVRISIGTIQSFFRKLSAKLGIPIILGENRVNELLEICSKRVDKIKVIFEENKSNHLKITSKEFLLGEIVKKEKNQADYSEFREFVFFLQKQKNLRSFDKIKEDYLIKKKNILSNQVGQNIFLRDYYKVLQLLFEAISDSGKFYEDFQIKDRYELLSILYNSDKYSDKNEISLYNFESQVKSLNRTVNWSNVLIVDEGQDFHILEKEILFKLKGSENIIVASGGQAQLIRHSKLLDWSVSLGKKISSFPVNLYGNSFRQKQNLIEFVNLFSIKYGFNLGLKSSSESKGLGKIIIDKRPRNNFIHEDVFLDIFSNGIINGCSPYESLLLLIPSKGYTSKVVSSNFKISETDQIIQTEDSKNRKLNELYPSEEPHLEG